MNLRHFQHLLLGAFLATSLASARASTLLYSLFSTNIQPAPDTRQGHQVALDGKLAVVSSGSDVVKVYDAETGTLLHRLKSYTYRFGPIAVSKTRIAIGNVLRGDPGAVWIYDVASVKPDEPVFTLEPPDGVSFLACALSDDRVVVLGGHVDCNRGPPSAMRICG